MHHRPTKPFDSLILAQKWFVPHAQHEVGPRPQRCTDTSLSDAKTYRSRICEDHSVIVCEHDSMWKTH